MVKKLDHKLRKTKNKVRKFSSALGLSALLLFNGLSNNCKSPASPGIPDSKPIAILNVSPGSGTAPLEERITVDGTPGIGGNIIEYTLKIDDSYDLTGLSEYGRINGPARINKTSDETRIQKNYNQSRRQARRTEKPGRREIPEKELREQIEIKDFEAEVPKINFEMSPTLENIQPYKMIVLGNFDEVDEILKSSIPIDITRIYDNKTDKDIEIFFTGQVTDSNGIVSSPVSRSIIVSPQAEIYINIAGTLHKRGMLKVFDSNRNLLETNNSDNEGYISTNSSGQFNFQIKKTASELEDIIIRAAHGTGNPQSWVRTKNFPAVSQNGISIIAVPYGEFAANPDEFRDFMDEVTNDGNPRMFDYENFNRGFIIIKENLDDSIDNGKPEGEGKFNSQQIQYIKNILTPGVENVEKILGTSNYTIKIKATSEQNYQPGAGVIYIIPSKAPAGNPNYGGVCDFTANIGNLIQGADTYIKDSLTPAEWGLKAATLHEILHILYNHTTNPNSIMGKGGITYYTSLDLKGTFVYEPSYRTSGWRTNGRPVENLKYFLGKNFNNWD